MTLAIAKREQEGRAVLCALREVRPPFSPESVVADFSVLLKTYGLYVVTGDFYGGAWPPERFQVHGIRYEQSAAPKSDLYRDLLPLLNSRKVELLDHARLIAQLCGLERRTARSGRDSIDHMPNFHDDVCNAAAGALVLASADAAAWIRNLKPVLARLQTMSPDPRYMQRRQDRFIQHRHLNASEAHLGERRLAQMRRAAIETKESEMRKPFDGAKTLYAAPSPQNTNFAGLFLNRAGHLFDKHGNRWGRSQIAELRRSQMAFDELPASAAGLPEPKLSEKD
jgi:hypothetical protein